MICFWLLIHKHIQNYLVGRIPILQYSTEPGMYFFYLALVEVAQFVCLDFADG